ncbi:MAG: hypothetical protein GYB20_13520 [Oceanospirillales bacterium]|nr:hypothetical protein [Oceanospirillales bacterium]MBR9888698.1 hypothetical protein [Oceanospirillales bacterium]
MSEREWKSMSLPYREGAYLLDPYYHLCQKRAEGVFRLHDNAPDSFANTEYYRIYYEKTDVVDEMCAIFQLSDDVSALVSVCRIDSENCYDSQDFDYLYGCYSILEVIIKNWWGIKRTNSFTETETAAIGARLDGALDNFGASLLTPREMQVARLSLEGYSVKAQALRLNISSETVKSYKKSIYHKLDISSQAELFNLFIGSLKAYNPESAPDPLIGYL